MHSDNDKFINKIVKSKGWRMKLGLLTTISSHPMPITKKWELFIYGNDTNVIFLYFYSICIPVH